MNTNLKIFVLTMLAVLPAVNAKEALEIDDPMPTAKTEMKNVDGKMLTLDEVSGKEGTLVIFSCRHCPFVQAWQGRMVDIGNEYQKKGVGVVFINSNDPEKYPQDNFDSMKEQAKENGYEFPYVMDATSKVARAFGAGRTPEVFLFDADDKLVYHGAIDDSLRKPDNVKEPYLRNALDALLAGEEIKTKETRSIGCSIKFRKQDEQ